MKILDIAPFGIFPPRGGAPARIHNINVKLSKYNSIKNIFLFSQGIRSFEVKFPMKSWCTKINSDYKEYRYINYMSIFINHLTSFFFNIQPIFSGDLLNITNPSVLLEEINQSDIIIVEFPWQFQHIFKINKKKKPIILVEHDVEVDLMQQVIRVFPFLNKSLIKIAMEKEKYAVENANAIFVTSNEDKKRLCELYCISENKIFVIPNGANIQNFSSYENKMVIKKELGLPNKKIVLFVGWIHPPNIEAVEEIIKISNKLNGDILFLIAGRVGAIFKNNNKYKNILFTGEVENILPYFKAADIAINPMLSGSGTNIKMLEYLASGLPTITTPTGARGLTLENNKHAIIANIIDFPNVIKELLNNNEKQIELSQNGIKLIESKYCWNNIANKEEKLLRKIYEKSLSYR